MPDSPGGGVIARERVAPAKLRAGHARPLPGVVGVGVPDDPHVYHVFPQKGGQDLLYRLIIQQSG